mgnify:FL=1|tara:strand:- start:808 stop:1014 length:207 start_codon:yes stop_codon:yes gene_type:complete
MRYNSPYEIGLGENVKYEGKDYLVLINYIKGETDAKGFTPKTDRTILIDDDGIRTTVYDYRTLEVLNV